MKGISKPSTASPPNHFTAPFFRRSRVFSEAATSSTNARASPRPLSVGMGVSLSTTDPLLCGPGECAGSAVAKFWNMAGISVVGSTADSACFKNPTEISTRTTEMLSSPPAFFAASTKASATLARPASRFPSSTFSIFLSGTIFESPSEHNRKISPPSISKEVPSMFTEERVSERPNLPMALVMTPRISGGSDFSSHATPLSADSAAAKLWSDVSCWSALFRNRYKRLSPA